MARRELALPFRVRPHGALGPQSEYGLSALSSRLVASTAPPGTCLSVACAAPPHTSPLSIARPRSALLRSLRARLFHVRPRRALPSCPLHGHMFSARSVHYPATHVPAPSVHVPAVSLLSRSVYGPDVHLPPGLCTAPQGNLHASFHTQLRQALADLFYVRPRHAPPNCPLHGPAVSSPFRSVYSAALHLAPSLSTASPRNPHASLHAQLRRALFYLLRVRPRLTPPSFPSHGPAVHFSARSVHGSAVHFPACSMCGPAAHCPLVRCTAPGSLHARALPRDALTGPFRAWPCREFALSFRVRPRRAFGPRSMYSPAA